MAAKRRKKKFEHEDLAGQFRAGDFDEENAQTEQRFTDRSKHAEQEKILRTAAMRAAAEQLSPSDVESLRVGQVLQVYSLFCEVEHEGTLYLCVTRKTLQKLADTAIVVGDRVRFRESGTKDELGRPEAVIEQTLPRESILTRADSFKGTEQRPIVANADQMLIVASMLNPQVKWGLVDRMLIAAQSGKLKPIICLNKVDLIEDEVLLTEPDAVLEHYEWLGAHTLKTSIETGEGLDELRTLLADHATVLSGHSGVGKSSLIRAIQPALDLRIGEVSEFTAKGRHTTTSARRYPLDFGGAVIDTPGVKVFGLWGVTRENLEVYFPDVVAGSAPAWRVESFKRIRESLAG